MNCLVFCIMQNIQNSHINQNKKEQNIWPQYHLTKAFDKFSQNKCLGQKPLSYEGSKPYFSSKNKVKYKNLSKLFELDQVNQNIQISIDFF